MDTQRINIKKLHPNNGQIPGLPANPRSWTKADVQKIARSLRETPELFEARPIIVYPQDGEFVILGGNLRYEGCKANKEKDAPCFVIPEGTPVEKLKEIVIKDNGSFGEWDYDALANLWDDLPLPDWGVPTWDTQESGGIGGESPEVQEDDFDEDNDEIKTRCNPGDIWQLGDHRLMCGDSTDLEEVKRLMGGGTIKADMVLTDPPYGINLDGDNSKRGKDTSLMKGGYKLKSFIDDSTIYAEKAFDIVQALNIKVQVWFGANYYCHHLPETGNWLVWDKRVEEKMSNTNSDCELAWVKDGHNSCRIFRYLWNGLIKAGEKDERRVHPTQKPIALMDHCIQRYAPDANCILDLFGGSGTTMMACEQLGRKCYMMELDPHYCDVILARWEKLTGREAVKIQ